MDPAALAGLCSLLAAGQPAGPLPPGVLSASARNENGGMAGGDAGAAAAGGQVTPGGSGPAG